MDTRSKHAAVWVTVTLALCALLLAPAAMACPFCTALLPTLNQLRQQSSAAALVEVDSQDASQTTTVRVHKTLEGGPRISERKSLRLALHVTARPGTLLLIFGDGASDLPLEKLSWHAVAVNESSYAYFARAPRLSEPAVRRLTYFAPFLESADPLAAQDAYLEFGHASLADVTQVAELLPQQRMRQWLADPAVPQDRKGFYGLALGLTQDPQSRIANQEALRQQIVAPADDFRGGFDGVLGGYLLLAGNGGLETIKSRYLSNSAAAEGDVRHALTALRFYHEYGREIPAARLQDALEQLLRRPEFAAVVITDLARWEDWGALERIVALYQDKAYADPAVGRAVVGYLLAAPVDLAAASLARLRKLDPQGVAAAEQYLSRTTSVPSSSQ